MFNVVGSKRENARVRDYDVGRMVAGFLQRLGCMPCFRDYGEVRLIFQQTP
jgi:hypothetical protein